MLLLRRARDFNDETGCWRHFGVLGSWGDVGT